VVVHVPHAMTLVGASLKVATDSWEHLAVLTLEEIFPPFGLVITGGDVELRVLRDDDLPELVNLVRGGIQEPGRPMPFLTDWHQQTYSPGSPDGFPASSLAWWWTQRAQFAADNWRLALTVRQRGALVGMQDLGASNFNVSRTIKTGSWLGLAHQGQGLGTLMRQLAVGLAFDELGAVQCRSAYIVGNHASAAVSRKTGYVTDGQRRIVQRARDGEVGADEQGVVVTPDTYRRPEIKVTTRGVDSLKEFLAIGR
jgi:RimJ/RimL family protein N-acetyltransferase